VNNLTGDGLSEAVKKLAIFASTRRDGRIVGTLGRRRRNHHDPEPLYLLHLSSFSHYIIIKGGGRDMKTLTRFLFIALFLVSLSGCAGTYTAIGTDSGQSDHPNNCPMMNDQDCHAWFYGSGSP
jgi:hypothetical protein